jgi:DNA-binding SARP family transcriptional activator
MGKPIKRSVFEFKGTFAMSLLKIRLFGKFSVHREGRPLKGLDSGRAKELFCYLLLNRDRPQPRETLASLLWEASSSAQAKKYLRQALWQLQNALALPTDQEGEDVLFVEPEWIRINPRADIWLDVAIFEDAFTMVRGLPGDVMDTEQARALNLVVQLYGGDLLEGWYQDWCLYERERLQNMWLAILEKLMAYCETYEAYEEGMVYGRSVLRFDRAHERTHRRMMRLQYLAGDRTAALRQYERCSVALDEELGVKPAGNTQGLYQQIFNDSFDRTAPPEKSAGTEEFSLLPNVVSRLNQLRRMLTDVKSHVSQDLETIERALDRQ